MNAKPVVYIDRSSIAGAEPERASLATKPFSAIKAERVNWLWPARIPLGKLTLIAGDPGLGKSMLTAFIAATVSTGRAWPDGTHAPAGDVLMVNLEDGQADTTRPRLDAAGADVDHVHAADLVRHPDGTLRCMTLADVQPIADALERMPKPRAVILDPVSAFMGSADSHVAADVRGALAPLAELAQRSGVAFILIAHLNKSSAQSAMNRINGSGAYVAACRAAWIVVKDKDDEGRRLLLPLKNNLGPDQGGLAYRVAVAEGGTPYVEFEAEPVNIRADDALAAPGDDEGADDPASFLRDLLADGPMSARDIKAEARDFGLTEKQLRNARERLGIKPRKAGMDGGWMWELPAEDAPKMPKMPPFLEGHLREKRAPSGDGEAEL
ncbi:AAA family ATPase [Metallibacterium sp.]|uniref:AAA family ATPase n=1 Tax=Metallibacterium sp. TaxID=2940281 RepID=UPI002607DB45|nr:AAA family ATPase [Metallibacterium sp.]